MKAKSTIQQKKKKEVKNSFDILDFVCLRDLLLVKALRPEDDDVVDPAQYEDKPEFGEIIKRGELVVDNRLKVGTIIRFGKYSTEAIRNKGKDYFLVHEEDTSMVLNSNETT